MLLEISFKKLQLIIQVPVQLRQLQRILVHSFMKLKQPDLQLILLMYCNL